MRGAGALAWLLFSLAGCGTTPLAETPPDPPGGTRGLSAAEDSLVGMARRVVLAAPEVDEVWPGFWPRQRPFILVVPGEATLLYLSRGTPPSFLRELPSPGSGRLYVGPDSLPDLTANERFSFDLAYPVGDGTATAVRHDGDRILTLRLLYHEGFHAFQDGAFQQRDRPARDRSAGFEPTPELRALAEVERRILAGALLEVDSLSVDAVLRRYLAVRELRIRQTPPDVAEVERVLERIEGTAEFAAVSGTAAAFGWDAQEKARGLEPYLTQPIRRSSLGLDWEIRQRVYGTGAALALLLDRLSVPWRGAIEAGKSLDEVLLDRLGTPDARWIEETLDVYGYEAILDASEK